MEERFKTFTLLITNISRCIHKLKSEEMAEYDLKSSHVSCLYYLYKERSLTAKRLCDICAEDKANISRSLKYLEGNGYIYHKSTEHKKYQTPIELTEKGIHVAKEIAKKIDSVLAEASEGLDDEHRRAMYQSLMLVNANLQRMCDRYETAK